VGPDPDLLATYGPGSRHQQLFINAQIGYRYLAVNARRVAGVNVRRAINYALDRAAIAAFMSEMPNDNYLPPGIPGYSGTHTYPLGRPDIAAATALLAGARPSLVLYIEDRPLERSIADEVADDLNVVGIDVTVVAFDLAEFFRRIGDPDEPFDLALTSWFADYPDPFEFLNVLLDGRSADNFSHFDDPSFNARLRAAAALTDAAARTDAYRRLDTDLMNAAPLAVLDNPTSYDFFSSRVGCQIFTPTYGIDLAALCP
jgi:peptide/nickel transport system substrate-binding protein